MMTILIFSSRDVRKAALAFSAGSAAGLGNQLDRKQEMQLDRECSWTGNAYAAGNIKRSLIFVWTYVGISAEVGVFTYGFMFRSI